MVVTFQVQIAWILLIRPGNQWNPFKSDFSELVADPAVALLRVCTLTVLFMSLTFTKQPLVEVLGGNVS